MMLLMERMARIGHLVVLIVSAVAVAGGILATLQLGDLMLQAMMR